MNFRWFRCLAVMAGQDLSRVVQTETCGIPTSTRDRSRAWLRKGELTLYQLPNRYAGPFAPIAGPDGAVWFTESYDHKIGRTTSDGRINEFSGLSGNATAITLGPDGNLWFSEYQGDKVGKITLTGDIT